jgi:hypothetical protein
VRGELPERLDGIVLDGHAVVLLERARTELLLTPAEDQPGDVEARKHVTYRGGMVLAVDEDDHRH